MAFKFEELRVYQDALEFSSSIYDLTKTWKGNYYTLADQFKRAALSISLNVAEGSGRTSKDFLHFLSISRGSCYECVPILGVAKKIKLITEKEYETMYEQLESLAKSITALRNGVSRYSSK